MKPSCRIVFPILTLLCSAALVTAADFWTAKTAMPTSRNYLCAGVVNGKIYAIGSDGGTVNEEYDPVGDAWQGRAAMPTVRYWGFATGVVNGKIYAIGGAEPGNYLRVNEEYDPAGNTWASKALMPTARCGLAIGVANGKIYALGGRISSGPLGTNEEYDPVNNTWTSKAPMPTPRSYLGIGVIDNLIYAVGGYSASGTCRVVEEYDPVNNSWRTRDSMPTARAEFTVETVSQRLYAIGGYSSGPIATNEEYNPYMNVWRSRASMPTARWGPAAGSAGGKIYVVGGSAAPLFLSTNEEYTPDVPVQIAEQALHAQSSRCHLRVTPNPCRGRVVITLNGADQRTSGPPGRRPGHQPPSLDIYDAAGRVVRSFPLSPRYSLLATTVSWDGRDDLGRRIPAGVYFIHLKTGRETEIMPVVVLD